MKKETYYRVRYVGIFNFTAFAADGTTSVTWQIPQMQYQGQNVDSIFMGVQYYAKGMNHGDSITFQATDEDNILGYGAGTVLDEFASNLNPMPYGVEIECYQASLIPGLYIKVIYNNNGANDVGFSCNLLRHINTEKVL